ncbi:hypothetical protein CAEBREN_17647 [Caenorhabditis brenneri]|uniref:Uncharacterized protein n=1 Tax=Caenorhabditis brenneri TaxID=135651 RepID=G0NDX7_CAEBE|nr:hypothetical protein CAEBREN_17647 [Caenorhabditis brenneri]
MEKPYDQLIQAIKLLEERLSGAKVDEDSENRPTPEPQRVRLPSPSGSDSDEDDGATVVEENWISAEEDAEPEAGTSKGSPGFSRREPYNSIVMAPMCRVTTTLITGPEPQEIRFFLGFHPYEPYDATPPAHYIVKNGVIIRDPKVYKTPMEPELEGHGAKDFRRRRKSYDSKNTMRFTITGISVWKRTSEPPVTLRCMCSPHYHSREDNHSDRLICKSRAFGAWIAETLWDGGAIEGATVPTHFLLE